MKNWAIQAAMIRKSLIIILCFLYQPVFAQDIRFGSVAMDIPAVMHQRLVPLTDYLSEELKQPVVLKLSPSMKTAIKEISENTVELAYLTPVAYIRSHAKGNTRLIAKTVTNNRDSFQLMIVVKEDSPIKTIEDLIGKKFAFGDPAALLQRAVVVGSGIKLEQLGSYDFIGHYDNIARGVMRGFYDAGILKDTMAFKWQDKGLRVLYSSAHLPPYNLAASSKMDEKTFKQLKKAFLALDVHKARHRRIIKALDKKYDGFAETSDKEYDIIRQLTKPFE